MTHSQTTGAAPDADGAVAPSPPVRVDWSRAPGEHRLSITDFLTDGSLAALCAELSRLLGVGVCLLDREGHLIRRREPAAAGGRGSWSVDDAEPNAPTGGAGSVRVPLMLGDEPLGSFVMGPGKPRLPDADAREILERALILLARTSGELCEHELDLRHRIKEVAAVYRVSTLLSRAAGLQRVLETALESVIDALELDAGAIMLLAQDADGITSEREEDLTKATAKNLSNDWIDCPLPLSKGRLFDRLALKGEVVVSEDLASDDRVLIPDRVAAEGLRAAIHAGLIFQDRPIGVLRLYSRRPRVFREEEKRLLKSIAQHASVAVEQARLLGLEREKERVERQLSLAADVQRRMLPRGTFSRPGFDIAARYEPSFELGGDFYDFLDLSGHFGLIVGDVVGKGVAAALLMSSVRASLRAHAQQVYHLDEVVSRVNIALCRDTRDDEFASLWYGVIDPEKLRLTYCSAGHEPTFVVHVPKGRAPSASDVHELSVGGMVVGIDSSQRYQRAIYDLRPRDVLVAYTDGVLDAVNFDKQRFGKHRLRQAVLAALAANPEAKAADVVERIHWEVRQFAGLAPRQDDFTVVVVRVLEGTGKHKR